jgi:hypothetical protein
MDARHDSHLDSAASLDSEAACWEADDAQRAVNRAAIRRDVAVTHRQRCLPVPRWRSLKPCPRLYDGMIQRRRMTHAAMASVTPLTTYLKEASIMRATLTLIPVLAICGALASGQALAQATGTAATPQTNGAATGGTMQGTPTQSAQQQGTYQNGNGTSQGSMSDGTNSNTSGTYGHSRKSRSTSGTHGNRGTLNSNNGSNYPATSGSGH